MINENGLTLVTKTRKVKKTIHDEYNFYKRILTEIYPTGFVSVVSDTWSLWDVLTKTLPRLKNEIMSRDGRVVIRPDSGDPVRIVCGYTWKEITPEDIYDIDIVADNGIEVVKINDKYYLIKPNTNEKIYAKFILGDEIPENEVFGTIQLLWNIFGGTITKKGYNQLDTHIGCIYGDAITIERCQEICKRLKDKGFASTNMVYGIGSYSYLGQNSRDTFGFAMKTTYAVINGEEKLLYKNPKTDDGLKKSQRGLVIVYEEDNEIKWLDGFNENEFAKWAEEHQSTVKILLEPIFIDGCLVKETTLAEIRERLNNN